MKKTGRILAGLLTGVMALSLAACVWLIRQRRERRKDNVPIPLFRRSTDSELSDHEYYQ